MQQKQSAWAWQWENLQDDNLWLFTEWIYPAKLEDFRGQSVLDCGCGGGQHTLFTAPYAKTVTAVDLNALEAAKERTKDLRNVRFAEADLATMDLKEQFDIAYCIGVLHHTDDPRATLRNIVRHVKPGGRLILWVYSHEGNALNRWMVEPAKSFIVHHLPRKVVLWLSRILTMLVEIPVQTIYRLPLQFLPYYEYFQNWRKLSFERNVLNVFDKLNAPQTWFIRRDELEMWLKENDLENIHLSPYRGVSHRASGTKKAHSLVGSAA